MSMFSGLLGKLKGGQEAPKPDKDFLVGKVRQSELFKSVPKENLEEMLAHMESVGVRKDDEVIREGDEGDYYYLLVSGTAKVLRKSEDGSQKLLAELTEPSGFGEEALISNAKRNASVVMTSGGAVMRLSKDDFSTYVKEPLVEWLSPVEAQKKVEQGAKWIDVRDEADAKKSRLHGALSIPIDDIRKKMFELDKNTYYVCYCQNGRLSSTAAFLMKQKGFQVGVLRGGVQALERAGRGGV